MQHLSRFRCDFVSLPAQYLGTVQLRSGHLRSIALEHGRSFRTGVLQKLWCLPRYRSGSAPSPENTSAKVKRCAYLRPSSPTAISCFRLPTKAHLCNTVAPRKIRCRVLLEGGARYTKYETYRPLFFSCTLFVQALWCSLTFFRDPRPACDPAVLNFFPPPPSPPPPLALFRVDVLFHNVTTPPTNRTYTKQKSWSRTTSRRPWKGWCPGWTTGVSTQPYGSCTSRCTERTVPWNSAGLFAFRCVIVVSPIQPSVNMCHVRANCGALEAWSLWRATLCCQNSGEWCHTDRTSGESCATNESAPIVSPPSSGVA